MTQSRIELSYKILNDFLMKPQIEVKLFQWTNPSDCSTQHVAKLEFVFIKHFDSNFPEEIVVRAFKKKALEYMINILDSNGYKVTKIGNK